MDYFTYRDAIFASNLSANARLVALAISYHYNWKEGNKAFPSIQSLIKETGLSKATIHRSKNELVSQGYLVSQRRFNDSNLYLPQIPSQSHTETLVVSERYTNNEYNNEINNEKIDDSDESSFDLNIIDVKVLDENSFAEAAAWPAWDLFENTERESTYARPARTDNKVLSGNVPNDGGNSGRDEQEYSAFEVVDW